MGRHESRRPPLLLALCLALVGCGGAPLSVADAAVDAAPADAAPDARITDASDTGTPDAHPGCEGVPPSGRCDGDVLLTCTAGHLSQRDCAAESTRCLHSAAAPPRCGAEPEQCVDLPVGGLCAGDRLYLCHTDWLRHLDCIGLGGRCGVAGGRPGCEPRVTGARQASGVITGDWRPYSESGLGAVSTSAAEGVTVVVHRASDDTPLGFGITDASGAYRIPYDPGGGPDGVYLRVTALRFTASHRLWVSDDEDATYGWDSAAVDDADGQPHIDLHVSEPEDSGALSIFGVLHRDTEAAAALVHRGLPPLQAYWERGQRLYCGTCHSHGRIFLLGEPADTDEYDDCVISHEFGHYLAWAVSRDDSPGGAHDGTPTDPRLAWSEGLATWLGLQLLGELLYIDTKATGATVRDPEDMGWDADPAGPLDQDLSEYVVLESLWDITDPVDATDPMARSPADIFAVLTGYLPSPGMADRAFGGVDLVDFLDGWRCQGLGDDAGLTALIVDDQGFPYDFGGPAAPCPKPVEPAQLVLTIWPSLPLQVVLTLADRSHSDDVTAQLVLPPGHPPPADALRTLAPSSPSQPQTIRWQLGAGATPAWVRVGVTLQRGRGGADHLSVQARLKPPADPGPGPMRLSLGDLLHLRVRRR